MKRVVVKVGTRLLTGEENLLDVEKVRKVVAEIADIRGLGVEVLLVSSGAIGAGMGILGLRRRPSSIHELQAVAAIGQNQLIGLYSELFKEHGIIAAQMLLTQDDFDNRRRYLNMKWTIKELLKKGAIPVINENDSVATDELKCGDNDRLSSLVADLSESECLIVLTNVDGLLDEKNELIRHIEEMTPKMERLVRKTKCDLSLGGMGTKLEAAKQAMGAGIQCVIANGNRKGVLRTIIEKGGVGTVCRPSRRMIAKKRWIAFSSKTKGAIIVDDGAKEVLVKRNKSLLASGVVSARGRFKQKDVLSVVDEASNEFARGVTNYSSDEMARVKGMKTAQIKALFPGRKQYEVIHRDSLAIL
ncbi:MAG: glutamate 5-kinase [Candidatus Omnitrophota bacterium]